MYEFCPHCGQTIEQEQVAGRMLVCGMCGLEIGFVGAVQRTAGDEVEAQIRAGTAARCRCCAQAVELKLPAKTLAPHYAAGTKKICPGSGKPATPPAPTPGSAAERLAAHMTRDVIKLIYCPRAGAARIEIVTLEYLDKSERVRIQIEALREMLGHDFRLRDYPPALNKPHLAAWIGADACVVAAKHEQGGYTSIPDAEVTAVLADLRQHAARFF